MASVRRSRENHWRILLRARGVATICSQSREGPAPSTFDVKISTVSPEARTESSGTRRPLRRAPIHAWAASGWVGDAKSIGGAPVGHVLTLPFGVETYTPS